MRIAGRHTCMRGQIFVPHLHAWAGLRCLSLRGRTEERQERQYFAGSKPLFQREMACLSVESRYIKKRLCTHFSQQPACKQAHQDPLVMGQTQIQATAWHGKKIEGMLVSITRGLIVLISRDDDLNSAVLKFFVP